MIFHQACTVPTGVWKNLRRFVKALFKGQTGIRRVLVSMSQVFPKACIGPIRASSV